MKLTDKDIAKIEIINFVAEDIAGADFSGSKIKVFLRLLDNFEQEVYREAH